MRPARFYAGVFGIAFSTLTLEIVETRLLSVVSWYHLAFFVISAAMFGMTAGAVWVYLRRDRFSESALSADLALHGAAFALTTGLSLFVQVTLAPAMVFSLSTAIVFAELALTLAAPFFFSGVVISLALTRSPFPVGRVYAADLAGAALGCLGVIALLDVLDAPSAILLSGAIAALSAALFAGSAPGTSRQAGGIAAPLLSRPLVIALVMGLLGAANATTLHGIQPILIKFAAEKRDRRLQYEKWNSFSRVAVTTEGAATGELALWGPSPTLKPGRTIETKSVTIDGTAGTSMYRFDGDVSAVDFLPYDITNLVYSVRNSGRSAVIGSGSGRDVLSAWVFGSRDVTGVEINPILVDLLTNERLFADFAGLHKLPGVRLVVDEARSWFSRTDERFDTIQMSMIDTWAATGAGAFTLTENGLYTVEAWRIFLGRLAGGGLFTVSRWYAPGEVNETGRMISLAAAALLESGASDARNHIFLAATGHVATLILSLDPLSAEDVGRLRETCARYEYKILLAPGAPPASEVLGRIVASGGREELERYTSGLPLDLTPPTDDRPFFFNLLPLTRPHLVLRFLGGDMGVTGGNATATLTLGTIVLLSAILVTVTIVLPLRASARRADRRLVAAGTTYFALLGMGFMLVEIGLLQRLSVFLGHPIYSLSVVLFSLILATGLGSFLSERFKMESSSGTIIAWSALLGGYLGFLPLWMPAAFERLGSSPTPVRAVLAVAIIAPAGLLMGFGFPAGMRLVSALDPGPTPWFWGINGAAGVLASAMAVALSIALGIKAVILIGALCYLGLAPAALSLSAARKGVGRP